MITLQEYISQWPAHFPAQASPWLLPKEISSLIQGSLKKLSEDFTIKGEIAIHRNAVVEEHVVLKGPIIISDRCFVGAHAYLRAGVYLDENVSIGPGCEVKSSFIMSRSSLAHFNFVGDSIIGSGVNMEAGSIIANHHNDRENKIIEVMIDGKKINTGIEKFGALVGDNSKIGANAVLSPGTILPPNSIVSRLSLIAQC
jgi:NDP-sugar pyrophosphorylase family protein